MLRGYHVVCQQCMPTDCKYVIVKMKLNLKWN